MNNATTTSGGNLTQSGVFRAFKPAETAEANNDETTVLALQNSMLNWPRLLETLEQAGHAIPANRREELKGDYEKLANTVKTAVSSVEGGSDAKGQLVVVQNAWANFERFTNDIVNSDAVLKAAFMTTEAQESVTKEETTSNNADNKKASKEDFAASGAHQTAGGKAAANGVSAPQQAQQKPTTVDDLVKHLCGGKFPDDKLRHRVIEVGVRLFMSRLLTLEQLDGLVNDDNLLLTYVNGPEGQVVEKIKKRIGSTDRASNLIRGFARDEVTPAQFIEYIKSPQTIPEFPIDFDNDAIIVPDMDGEPVVELPDIFLDNGKVVTYDGTAFYDSVTDEPIRNSEQIKKLEAEYQAKLKAAEAQGKETQSADFEVEMDFGDTPVAVDLEGLGIADDDTQKPTGVIAEPEAEPAVQNVMQGISADYDGESSDNQTVVNNPESSIPVEPKTVSKEEDTQSVLELADKLTGSGGDLVEAKVSIGGEKLTEKQLENKTAGLDEIEERLREQIKTLTEQGQKGNQDEIAKLTRRLESIQAEKDNYAKALELVQAKNAEFENKLKLAQEGTKQANANASAAVAKAALLEGQLGDLQKQIEELENNNEDANQRAKLEKQLLEASEQLNEQQAAIKKANREAAEAKADFAKQLGLVKDNTDKLVSAALKKQEEATAKLMEDAQTKHQEQLKALQKELEAARKEAARQAAANQQAAITQQQEIARNNLAALVNNKIAGAEMAALAASEGTQKVYGQYVTRLKNIIPGIMSGSYDQARVEELVKKRTTQLQESLIKVKEREAQEQAAKEQKTQAALEEAQKQLEAAKAKAAQKQKPVVVKQPSSKPKAQPLAKTTLQLKDEAIDAAIKKAEAKRDKLLESLQDDNERTIFTPKILELFTGKQGIITALAHKKKHPDNELNKLKGHIRGQEAANKMAVTKLEQEIAQYRAEQKNPKAKPGFLSTLKGKIITGAAGVGITAAVLLGKGKSDNGPKKPDGKEPPVPTNNSGIDNPETAKQPNKKANTAKIEVEKPKKGNTAKIEVEKTKKAQKKNPEPPKKVTFSIDQSRLRTAAATNENLVVVERLQDGAKVLVVDVANNLLRANGSVKVNGDAIIGSVPAATLSKVAPEKQEQAVRNMDNIARRIARASFNNKKSPIPAALDEANSKEYIRGFAVSSETSKPNSPNVSVLFKNGTVLRCWIPSDISYNPVTSSFEGGIASYGTMPVIPEGKDGKPLLTIKSNGVYLKKNGRHHMIELNLNNVAGAQVWSNN